ncbi:MAG: hypothetical protein RMX68_005800 [Aulosira sp. ZfuVER01]|nr:hypothetical protein [Aulosira sp. ZfuVER01]MDZ8000488.1 hypothetical protein [Aulosira sp. DedVER01a]MDZ8052960.1 hypothetical protein [Aulosira sp. ZfuCHP01]
MHTIISVKSVFTCKTPSAGWVNLAQIRQVIDDKNEGIIIVTWCDGDTQVFYGENASAIIAALEEAPSPSIPEESTDKSKFLMDKGDFVLNSMVSGLAVKFLASLTGQSPDFWIQQIWKQGTAQFETLTNEEIEQQISAYFANKAKESDASFMVVERHKEKL